MEVSLEFERPIYDLEKRIQALRGLEASGIDVSDALSRLEEQVRVLSRRVYSGLTPWQRVQISRHPRRPYLLDLVARLFTDFDELHGDRAGFEDAALISGLARYRGRPVAVIGHQKGRSTKENIQRNFGMPRPEGYRKALRVMRLAHRYGRPIITFIDTPGAFPGLDAEARGQAEAIARNIEEMCTFEVPIISVVVGEGGSGGALAIGVGNRVLMLEQATYSVISPEGCAAILWRDRALGPEAAKALCITAPDCLSLGVVDEIIAEPARGAHRDWDATAESIGSALSRHLDELTQLDGAALRMHRCERYRRLGVFRDAQDEE